MLDLAVLIAFIPLSVLALLPVYWAWRFVLYYRRHTYVTPAIQEPWPSVAIILCLRGADPSLDACLDGLLHQEFPSYQIRIVVDHVDDPAWNRVQEILGRGYPSSVQVQVQALERHCPSCSLKVCAQLQVITRLAADVAVVALIDADSIPAPDWLRAMVLPLADPRVGASSGIRWYASLDGGWGSLLRHAFNAGAFPQLLAFRHPWGGSLAVRAEMFRDAKMQERWRRALCEDSAVSGPLRERGLRLVFVPAATQINSESISFDGCLRFIQRQLLCPRLDCTAWPSLLALNILNFLALFVLVAFTAAEVCLEEWEWALGAGCILGLYVAGMGTALGAAEIAIRRNFRLRGHQSPPLTTWHWKMLPVLVLTQFVYIFFLLRACRMRQVVWRGIAYAIQGPGNIRLQKYEPYQITDQDAGSRHSVV
jgi:hypothetical protein